MIENQSDACMIPIDLIDMDESKNPRKAKSQSEIEALRTSIRANNVLQSVLVRPSAVTPGRFELVAGYSRFKIAREEGHTEIPCVIRTMTDAEAHEYAIAENTKRADMTLVDEGRAAVKLLIECKNDHEEVCRRLDCSSKKLRSLILLSHACDEVSQALCDKKIKIGHGEILCALRPDAQIAGLKRILDGNLTVEQTLEGIGRGTLNLNKAIFDTRDCEQCRHNSDHQASLFSNDFAGARCLNATCFTEKTNVAVNDVIAREAESHPVVYKDTEVASGTHVTIIARGDTGVGNEQLEACKGCVTYGAIVRTTVKEAGMVERAQCFNLSCHAKMVASYQAIIAEPVPTTNGKKQNASDVPAIFGKPKKNSTKPDAMPAKIIEKHHKAVRKSAATAVKADKKIGYAIAILSMLSDGNIKLSREPRKWPTSLTQEGRGKALLILLEQSEEYLLNFMLDVSATVAEKGQGHITGSDPRQLDSSTFGRLAHAVVKFAAPNIADHFTVDNEYLEALTKPVIANLMKTAGFVEHFNAKEGAKAFDKLAAGGKGTLIDTILKSGFSFEGFLPAALKKLTDNH